MTAALHRVELLCDRHFADNVAFTVIEADLSRRDLTYGFLREESTKFAAALSRLGIDAGDRVGVLMGKSAELVITLLGIWRRGAVHVPLFTAFAPAAIALRLNASGAKVVVCDADQQHKLTASDDLLTAQRSLTIVAGDPAEAGSMPFAEMLDTQSSYDPRGAARAIGGSGLLAHLYTSGTTGAPKAVPVPLRAVAKFQAYLEYGLDVREDDVYWNTADPGWAYGLYWGIIGPLLSGRRNLLLHPRFSPELTWAVCTDFSVTNLTAAPTLYRALQASSTPVPPNLRLRCTSSAGEPLTPDVIDWMRRELNVEVRDHFGQSETGMTIANGWHPETLAQVKAGSMGRPLPGWKADVLLPDTDQPAPIGVVGRVAIDATSPLMSFTGYVDDAESTSARFSADGRWYLTGDTGRVDEDGYFYFSSRDDDVIMMAGYRIGPFDIESVLVQHPAVSEAAAVGVPDTLRGEVVEAFIVLRSGREASDALVTELQQLVSKKYSAHAYPRAIHFVGSLPKTPSGKVQRFMFRCDHATAPLATPDTTQA
jgi:acetyl-CoA synthetase